MLEYKKTELRTKISKRIDEPSYLLKPFKKVINAGDILNHILNNNPEADLKIKEGLINVDINNNNIIKSFEMRF